MSGPTEETATSSPEKAPARGLPLGKIALAVLAIAVLFLAGLWAKPYLQEFPRWLQGLGPWGPIAFILGYAAATVAFAPGSVLTLAAGALFGLVQGVLYVLVAATLGASASFLVARYLARGVIERRLEGNQRFAAIDRAIAEQGLKIVLLLRLSPIFPFNLLNYGLGLTRVRFIDYVIASAGMIPGTILYVYYGKLAGDVARLAGGAAVERGIGDWILWGLGLVATIAVTTVVTRVARRVLKEATTETPGEIRGETR